MKLNIITLRIIGIALISMVFLFFVVYLPNKQLDKDHRYTITTVTSIESPARGSDIADCEYQVNGKTYTSNFSVIAGYEDKIKVGVRFFMKFSPSDPNEARVIYELTVDDSLIAPSKGWKYLPR